MLVADLIERIETVDALAGRVKGAAELSALFKQGGWPQASPSAFVLPLGLRPDDRGAAAANAFTQMVDEVFGIVLYVRAAGDITGGRALPTIDQLVWATIAAVCGWGPEEAVGVFHLVRGDILAAEAGGVAYQLDFGIQQQVRR